MDKLKRQRRLARRLELETWDFLTLVKRIDELSGPSRAPVNTAACYSYQKAVYRVLELEGLGKG